MGRPVNLAASDGASDAALAERIVLLLAVRGQVRAALSFGPGPLRCPPIAVLRHGVGIEDGTVGKARLGGRGLCGRHARGPRRRLLPIRRLGPIRDDQVAADARRAACGTVARDLALPRCPDTSRSGHLAPGGWKGGNAPRRSNSRTIRMGDRRRGSVHPAYGDGCLVGDGAEVRRSRWRRTSDFRGTGSLRPLLRSDGSHTLVGELPLRGG